MNAWMQHLVIVPILLPLIAGAVMLLLDERRNKSKRFITFTTSLTLLGVSIILLRSNQEFVYLMSDWPAPFSIVLVADKLSNIMLVLTNFLGLSTLIFSFARWDKAGPRFHALLMLLLMGVNGAFLTGDLFNLFVFFEILLAASYGLALHGSGPRRIKASLHYIAINLVASSLFLIGTSLIYGVIGTLNMADLAMRLPGIAPDNIGLFSTGVALLSLAFLIKVGMWPLGFWLPATYLAASAPVAAVFSILSKVGIYSVLRMTVLLSGSVVGSVYSQWVFIGGLCTITYGCIASLSARSMSRIAIACIFVSSGTILAAIGMHNAAVLSGGLYYLVNSTLAIAALFLLIELLNRARGKYASILAKPVFTDEYHDPFEDGTIDEAQMSVVTPVALALLSIGFLVCALLLIGLPPLSGFIGKFVIMSSILEGGVNVTPLSWLFIGLIIISSITMLVSLTRAGIKVLWTPIKTLSSKVAFVEFISISALLSVCILLTVLSNPVMQHIGTTSAWLQTSQHYVDAVIAKEEDIL